MTFTASYKCPVSISAPTSSIGICENKSAACHRQAYKYLRTELFEQFLLYINLIKKTYSITLSPSAVQSETCQP